MKNINKRNLILDICLIALLIGVCIFLDSHKSDYRYAITTIERSLIYAVVAVSMNLVNGFTGLFSLGQAGFMAIGAYTTSILTIPLAKRAMVYYVDGINPVLENLILPTPIALILGGVFAAIFAALIGFPVLRLKSDYLAIATLGFAEIIRAVIQAPNLSKITNASFGLNNVPGFSSLLEVVIISAICIGIMLLIINSSYGRDFKAIREDEVAASCVGINLFRTKQLSFVISSFFAGVGGGMLAMFMRSCQASTFQVSLTYDILLIVVLGGIGSVSGSIIGAFIVTVGKEVLRFFDEPLTIAGVNIPLFRQGFRMVIFSILLMVIVLFYSKGIMGQKELSWDLIIKGFKNLKSKFTSKKQERGK